MPSSFRVAGKSDVGLVRPGNEDFLHIDEQNAVFAVCDGMGGHQAGEVASIMAASTLDTAFNRLSRELLADETLAIGRALPDNGNLLLRAIRLANRGIYTKAAVDPALNGMGTTVVALSLKDDMLSVAHVGDSRAYRLEDRSVTPLTSDHSWVAEIQQQQNITEAEASKMVGKNVITRALGVRDTVEVDYRLIRVKPGDKFILCSDGLCGFADDDEIFSVAHKAREENERMVESLIQMANDRGGMDNVTVIVLEITGVSESGLPEVEPFTLPAETAVQLEREDTWLEKINALLAEKDSADMEETAVKPQSRVALFVIFALFIIIAAAIVYFSTGD